MPGPFGWRRTARRKAEADLSRSSKERVFHACTEPGCIFCHEQLQCLDTHFSWYLNELYFEPSSIEEMRRSHGFCRRHTRHLLARGGPSTIGRIYLWMLPPFLAALGAAETAVLTQDTHRSLLTALQPTGRCGGCETEAKAPHWWVMQLRTTLDDPEVRQALHAGPTTCLEHFLTIAPYLEWDQLAAVLDVVIGPLRRAKDRPEDATLRERVELVRGLDADARLRRPDAPTRHSQASIACGADASRVVEPTSWSPTLASLHELLGEPGCPICHVRHRGLHDYFDWLSREIISAPSHQWSDALWLCPTHTWDFIALADPVAAEKLVAATAGYWHAQLSGLATGLRDQPPRRWWRRATTIPAHVRRVAAERGFERVRLTSLWALLGPGVQNAMLPPDRMLADLRTRALRRTECPACRHLATIGARTCDLLVRSLADLATLACYQQSSGVCYRDLPLAFHFCRDTEQARALARAARVRLEVLDWELDEALRKETWNMRHEPKGPEQSAWQRAAEHVSGSHLSDPTLIGLD